MNPADTVTLTLSRESAEELLRLCEDSLSRYGLFPGGDPRAFTPHNATGAEVAAHKAAVARCERHGLPAHEEIAHGIVVFDEAGNLLWHHQPGGYGLGLYFTGDDTNDEALTALRAALGEKP